MNEVLKAIIFIISFFSGVILQIGIPIIIFVVLMVSDLMFFLWLGIFFFPLHLIFSWRFYDKWVDFLASVFGEKQEQT